jgi:hypothetical protein
MAKVLTKSGASVSRSYLKRFFIKFKPTEKLVEYEMGIRVQDAIFYSTHILGSNLKGRSIWLNPNIITKICFWDGHVTLEFNHQTTVTLLLGMIEEMNLYAD